VRRRERSAVLNAAGPARFKQPRPLFGLNGLNLSTAASNRHARFGDHFLRARNVHLEKRAHECLLVFASRKSGEQGRIQAACVEQA